MKLPFLWLANLRNSQIAPEKQIKATYSSINLSSVLCERRLNFTCVIIVSNKILFVKGKMWPEAKDKRTKTGSMMKHGFILSQSWF